MKLYHPWCGVCRWRAMDIPLCVTSHLRVILYYNIRVRTLPHTSLFIFFNNSNLIVSYRSYEVVYVYMCFANIVSLKIMIYKFQIYNSNCAETRRTFVFLFSIKNVDYIISMFVIRFFFRLLKVLLRFFFCFCFCFLALVIPVLLLVR